MNCKEINKLNLEVVDLRRGVVTLFRLNRNLARQYLWQAENHNFPKETLELRTELIANLAGAMS